MRAARALVAIAFVAVPPAAALVACETGDQADPGPKPPPGPFDANIPETIGQQPCTQIAVPDGGPAHITGVVMEAHPEGGIPTPIPNAIIAVEYGGTYVPWCELSKASPYYLFGAVADDAGQFALDAKQGALGFHSFANRYLYDRASLDTTTAD